MYWREYRTSAAVVFSYGMSESTAWRIVQKVEGELIGLVTLHLAGPEGLVLSRFQERFYVAW